MAVLTWFLWAPLRLEIDSTRGIFQLRWLSIGRVQWLPESGIDHFRWKIFFWQNELWLNRLPAVSKKQGEAKQAVKKPQTRKPLPLKTTLRLLRNVLRSFKIKRLQIWWDSDDFVWNAQVYPLTAAFNSWSQHRIYINFTGRRDLVLQVENRLGRVAWAALKTFIYKQ